MNNQNLPVSQESFADRLKKAWGVLTNSASYQDQVEKATIMQEQFESLKGRENRIVDEEASLKQRQDELSKRFDDLAVKEANFAEREKALSAREKEFNLMEHRVQVATDLYKEEQDIPEETPDFKVNTEKFISGKLQDLQKDIKTFQDTLHQSPEMSSEEKRKMIAQSYMLQSKFLATLMVYSETLTKNEMSTCQIGDKKITLDALLETLPKMFGWEEKPDKNQTKSRRFILTPENSRAMRYTLTEEYANLLDGLFRLDVLRGDARNRVDYRLSFTQRWISTVIK